MTRLAVTLAAFALGVILTVAAFSGHFRWKLDWGGIGADPRDNCLDLWATENGWIHSHVAEITCVTRRDD